MPEVRAEAKTSSVRGSTMPTATPKRDGWYVYPCGEREEHIVKDRGLGDKIGVPLPRNEALALSDQIKSEACRLLPRNTRSA